jgi:colanic acid/amylovoran biosynthesis glycosyltransferase
LKKKRLLYFSGYDYHKSTFIRQDVEAMNNHLEIKYISYVDGELNSNLGQNSERVVFPESSFRSKIRWRLEAMGLIFNWKEKSYANKLAKAINSFNPHIIHCQFSYEGAKLIQNYDTDLPIVINFRGYGASYKLHNKKYVSWLKKILNQKNIYPIFVSNSLKNNLLKEGIRFRNKPNILYTGVDTDIFKRMKNVRLENTIFLQVSNFNDKKGQEITIHAFNKHLKNSENRMSQLVFVGDGKNMTKCKELVDSLNLQDKVLFKGAMNRQQIIGEMENSSIFVHHSITPSNGDQEGIPNSIIEAMSMELPILSTYHSGIPEAVEHGINGFLCLENDIESYSKQMSEIESWDYLEINREKVLKHFNINIHIDQLKHIYNHILD